MALPPPPAPSSALLLELADVIGWDRLAAFVGTFGGQRLYIPRTITPDHRIARAIGFDAAQALIERLGGNSVALPSTARRQMLVHRLARSSPPLTLGAIAERAGITDRAVQKILKRPLILPLPDAKIARSCQIDLFDD